MEASSPSSLQLLNCCGSSEKLLRPRGGEQIVSDSDLGENHPFKAPSLVPKAGLALLY